MGRSVLDAISRSFQLFATPVAAQSFPQRLLRAILFWGAPGFLWDAFSFGAFKAPVEWGTIALLMVVPTLIGSFVFAAMEEAYYRAKARNSR